MSGIETPVWVKYAGDLFFLILFLVFLFFVKPAPQNEDEWDDDSEGITGEVPNPLEKMLVTDDDATVTSDESDDGELTNSDKI
jgi:hypothetical protein